MYRLPLPGGEGAVIRSRAEPAFVPVYIAALGPANLALTGEVADGWVGNSFLVESSRAFFGPLEAAAARAGRSLSDLDLVVAVSAEFTEDVEAAGRRHGDGYAFTFGAMGSRASNFYNNAFARQGFGDDVAEVQRLWAAGDREAAAARVPIEIGLGTNLIGPPEVVRERLRAYRDCGVTTLRVTPVAGDLRESITVLGTLVDLAKDLNDGTEPGGAPQAPAAAVLPVNFSQEVNFSPAVKKKRSRRLFFTGCDLFTGKSGGAALPAPRGQVRHRLPGQDPAAVAPTAP